MRRDVLLGQRESSWLAHMFAVSDQVESELNAGRINVTKFVSFFVDFSRNFLLPTTPPSGRIRAEIGRCHDQVVP
jgi:hypothetical protein